MTLAKELRRARIHGQAFEYFIPLSELKRLITTSVIEKEILDGNPDMKPTDARKYAKRTEESAKKLFAILACGQNGAAICSLLDNKLFDQDLPFKVVESKSWSLWRREPEERIQAFDEWEEEKIEDFWRIQWWMIAPVFDKYSLDCLELADETILPFIPIDRQKAKDEGIPHMEIGGYSEVTAYRIHPAHHNFWDTSIPLVRNLMIALKSMTNSIQEKQPLIADKKLLSPDKTEFEKEKSILDMLGPKNHPHLINLLATFHKNQYYHLIFPCADCNLRTYWAKHKVPNLDKETVLWSIRQMSGIANALDCIHSFRETIDLNVAGGTRIQEGGRKLGVKTGEEKYGRHGDIKPENILYFKEGEFLKITDFGLGRFHGRDSRSGIDPRKVRGSLTYEPPDCTLGRPVSRAYDIWSLACLFLEFATWLLEGEEQIEAFSDVRGLDTGFISHDDTFFTIIIDEDREKDAEVKEAVTQWVDRLHGHEKCSELIHDLLDLVMGDMLKVEPSERITAQDLKWKMENLVEMAESSDTYLIGLVPTSRHKLSAVHKPLSGRGVHWEDKQTLAISRTWPQRQ
jgi:serine/threonine protein kinase